MIGLLISSILLNIASSQCDAPWCYNNAYMTVCHEVVECGLVNDRTVTSQKCDWYENGVAVKPGMFESYCSDCNNGNTFLCSFELGTDEVGHSGSGSANICIGENGNNGLDYDTDDSQLQTCYVNCGAEICLRRTDSDTGKVFYKTGRTVSSCPEHHPINTRQCCNNKDWAHCTCLQRPTVDVSDEVYDDLGQSNGFIDVWFGACSSSDEYHATDDGAVKLTNHDGISNYYYAITAKPYNPNFYITSLKAKSANADYYYECDRQSTNQDSNQFHSFVCNSLKSGAGGYMESPISIEMYTSGYTPDGTNYPFIKEEGLMTLTANEVKLVDLHLDADGQVSSSYTEDDDESGSSGKKTIFIIAGILITLAVIVFVGIIGYCIYKQRKNKGDVSFNHNDGTAAKDEADTAVTA